MYTGVLETRSWTKEAHFQKSGHLKTFWKKNFFRKFSLGIWAFRHKLQNIPSYFTWILLSYGWLWFLVDYPWCEVKFPGEKSQKKFFFSIFSNTQIFYEMGFIMRKWVAIRTIGPNKNNIKKIVSSRNIFYIFGYKFYINFL